MYAATNPDPQSELLANDAESRENGLAKRKQHRTVALSAMGVTIGSGVLMKLLNK